MLLLSLAICALSLVLITTIQKLYSSNESRKLPPGPKKLPLIGNLLDMPRGKRWETFATWGQKWGDIVSVSVLGTNLVMLNSLDVALEILEKKSRICADRPDAELSGNLIGWKDIMAFHHYGDHFKLCRKLMHTFLGTTASQKKFQHIHEEETPKFLKKVLARPDDLEHLVNHFTGALILRVMYGVPDDGKSHFVETADNAVTDLYTHASGEFLVDIFPFLRHVPGWVPGAGFQQRAKDWAVTFSSMVEKPFAWVKAQVSEGKGDASFVADLLRDGSEEEFTIKWTAASMSAAGPDTTAWTIYAFFKAMTMFPEVQARAQAEIDAVVGSDRLPTLNDRASLPYVEAVVLETLRWHPVAPLGFPHRVTEDDTYNGYFLPKGTLVQANVWKITRDPLLYPAPHEFDPTRYIPSNGKEIQPNPEYTFGWGRRGCPGRLMAREVLFLTCAMALAAFKVSKPVVNGVVIEPTVDRSEGVVSRPTHFNCVIEPRNAKALALLQERV